jgi:hypothetical protein
MMTGKLWGLISLTAKPAGRFQCAESSVYLELSENDNLYTRIELNHEGLFESCLLVNGIVIGSLSASELS